MSCEICKEHHFKYKCPRCTTKTCSLDCVKQHKRAKQCNGIRNKTAYVPIKQFTESHLLSDYRFLEDVDRKVYNGLTDPNLKVPAKSNEGFLPREHYRLKQATKDRGVNLTLLPGSFSRHQNNTTGFKHIGQRRAVLHWRVEWVFPQSDNVIYVNEGLAENCVVRSALEEYIHQTKGNPVYRQRLKQYCAEGMDSVRLFLNNGGLPGGKMRYKELKLDQTLAGNLAHTCILEYPTIHVVLKEFAEQYLNGKPEAKNQTKNDVEKEESTTLPKEESIASSVPSTPVHSEALPTSSEAISTESPAEDSTSMSPTESGEAPTIEGSTSLPTESSKALSIEGDSITPSAKDTIHSNDNSAAVSIESSP